MIDKPLPTKRGAATRVRLPDKSIITVQPVSAQQVVRCVRLDPDKGETEDEAAYWERITAQLEILAGPEHADITAKVDMETVQQLVGSLFAAGCGLDAEAYAAWQAAARQLAQRRTALEIIRDIDAAAVALAAELKLRPADVAAMPLLEIASLRKELAKVANEQSRFDAALHGIKL